MEPSFNLGSKAGRSAAKAHGESVARANRKALQAIDHTLNQQLDLRIKPRVYKRHVEGSKSYKTVALATQAARKVLEQLPDTEQPRVLIYPVLPDDARLESTLADIRYLLHFHSFTDMQYAINIAQMGHYTTQ